MRDIVMDTETTGLDHRKGDRLVEIGCIELINRIPTGREFHAFINPQGRDVHPDAERIHGITTAFLADKPKFDDVVDRFLDFIGNDGQLVIHNANFDMGFINMELDRIGRPPIPGDRVVDTLATEWLYLDLVDEASPDPATFPEFDEGLRAAMKEELHLFAANVLLTDRSMFELVNGTDTFVDARLARHYGIPEPSSPGFGSVTLDDRAGIVGRSGWLTALSYPTRTSPVRRGKWVVENLLCIDLDDPPPNVQPLAEEPPDDGTTPSMREQLEAPELIRGGELHAPARAPGAQAELVAPGGQQQLRLERHAERVVLEEAPFRAQARVAASARRAAAGHSDPRPRRPRR